MFARWLSTPLKDPESGRRHQSCGEEIANSVSHGIGLLGVIAGIPFLVKAASQHGVVGWVASVMIFSTALFFVYFASVLYHAFPRGRTKHTFRILEHMAIYVLIAGTYTPFCLGVLRGPLGWWLFVVVWVLAFLGIVLKGLGGVNYPRLSTALYLLMGWLVVVAVGPLWVKMPHMGFFWILFGGLSYTLGVIFFTYDYRWRYSHFIWHLFVIGGSTCHYFAVLWYAR